MDRYQSFLASLESSTPCHMSFHASFVFEKGRPAPENSQQPVEDVAHLAEDFKKEHDVTIMAST
jgi:hypothetical protein